MSVRAIGCRAVFRLAVATIVLAAASLANAQFTGGLTQRSGVVVDPEGVLRTRVYPDQNGMLARQRFEAAKATLGANVVAFSKMRKISLNRLEKTILSHQGVVSDEMRNLAGLLRVRYVFFYPQSNDIVLAGPAEGWTTDGGGRVVGLTTGRPIVQLQDLVVALRAYAPGASPTSVIGCSIDPTQEGLTAMQQFLRARGGNAVPSETQFIVNSLKQSLGLQRVSISGVSPKTNMARILVEADYRMKLIGIGLEIPPVKMVSFVEKADPASVARNALFRWYFVPDYQCVRVSPDNLAMELVGDGVKLVGEDELVTAEGTRKISAGGASPASKAFTMSFTKKYAELADRSPVYAELRNVIDLSVAAAYIQAQGYYKKAGWAMKFFADEKLFPVEVFNAPKMVESAVAAIWKGNRLTTPIGGGVHIEALNALSKENILPDEKNEVSQRYQSAVPNLAEGQWWWD